MILAINSSAQNNLEAILNLMLFKEGICHLVYNFWGSFFPSPISWAKNVIFGIENKRKKWLQK